MTFVNYYIDAVMGGSIGGYIAVGLLAIVVIIAIIQAGVDYGRGTSRSMIRFITVIGSAVLAFFATRIVCRAFVPDQLLGDVFRLDWEYLAPLFDAKLSLVVAPLVFLVLYLFFSMVTVLVHKLLCGLLGFTYGRNNILTRLFAMVVGVAHGAFFAMILLLPLLNFMMIYKDAAAADIAGGKAESGVVSVYEDYMKASLESPLVDIPMQYGGSLLLDEFERANVSALPK